MQKNISVRSSIIAFIKTEIHQDPDLDVQPDTDLLASGLLESMGMMRVIHHIEELYDFTVEPEDMVIDHFLSVSAMEMFVQSKLN